MARNTTATTATTAKRKFSVNTKSIPAGVPTIAAGIYKGNIVNIKADAADKRYASWEEVEDLQLFDVIEIITGKKGERVHTGEYKLVGALTYSVELANSEEQPLPMDTMSIFGGRCNIFFKRDEDGNWDLDTTADNYGVVNRTWSAFQKAVGLSDDDINSILESTPFDDDLEIAVPERLEGYPDALEALQACMFYKTFFSLIAETVTGKEVKVNVALRSRGDSPDMVNEVNTGSFNSSCGLLPADD
jgi:hypothetical protein